MEKFVFYDYETTGISPEYDQPLQFAAIITDLDLNEIERVDIRCQLSPHILPAPKALHVTGVNPIQLLNNNLPIDFNYYIENQIKLPLSRIFEPIFGDVKKTELALFTGDHVRNVYQPKMNTTRGLGMFA